MFIILLQPHLVSAAQLVDLVDEHDRVGGGRCLEALDQLAGHRANVRAPVALQNSRNAAFIKGALQLLMNRCG